MENELINCDFRTTTHPGYALAVYGITLIAAFGAMMLLSLLALAVTYPFFLFLEGVILLCALITLPVTLYSVSSFTFTFNADTLVIKGRRHQQTFTVKNLSKNAFIMTQSPLEERKNCGSLKIREMNLHFYGIRDFDKFKSYIETHF
ncbi:MAG: hypothetical protein ACI3YK_04125 [Eubacteriales bacterium]